MWDFGKEIMLIISKLNVLIRLGVINCINVFIYRFKIKTGQYKKTMRIKKIIVPESIIKNEKVEYQKSSFNQYPCIQEAETLLQGKIKLL